VRPRPCSFGRVRSPWIIAAALAVLLVAAACVPAPPPPPPTVPPGSTVYLTFDDGPSVYTPQILSVLQAKGVAVEVMGLEPTTSTLRMSSRRFA